MAEIERESKKWWAVNNGGVRFVLGWTCAPMNPDVWWVPEVGLSMTERFHLFATKAEAHRPSTVRAGEPSRRHNPQTRITGIRGPMSDESPTPTLAGVVDFLLGCGTLDGLWFGDAPPGRGAYWWRSFLRDATALDAPQQEPVAWVKEELEGLRLYFGENSKIAGICPARIPVPADAIALVRAIAAVEPIPTTAGPCPHGEDIEFCAFCRLDREAAPTSDDFGYMGPVRYAYRRDLAAPTSEPSARLSGVCRAGQHAKCQMADCDCRCHACEPAAVPDTSERDIAPTCFCGADHSGHKLGKPEWCVGRDPRVMAIAVPDYDHRKALLDDDFFEPPNAVPDVPPREEQRERLNTSLAYDRLVGNDRPEYPRTERVPREPEEPKP